MNPFIKVRIFVLVPLRKKLCLVLLHNHNRSLHKYTNRPLGHIWDITAASAQDWKSFESFRTAKNSGTQAL